MGFYVGWNMHDSIKTVLVVEDEDAVRGLLRTLLRLAGYSVLTCSDGAEALDLMAARGGVVHLLITDINLGPDMDGIELAEALRAAQTGMKVLYISGHEEPDRLAPSLASGSARFLMKPFTPGAFRESTSALLAEEALISLGSAS